MTLLSVLFKLFLLYIIYKLVFDFVIPLYTTTKRVKRQFGEMQQKMEERQRQYEQKVNVNNRRAEPEPKDGDYIDYEEVK
jgi:hypothetical protein